MNTFLKISGIIFWIIISLWLVNGLKYFAWEFKSKRKASKEREAINQKISNLEYELTSIDWFLALRPNNPYISSRKSSIENELIELKSKLL